MEATVLGALMTGWCVYAMGFLVILGKTGKVNHFITKEELDWLLHTHLTEQTDG